MFDRVIDLNMAVCSSKVCIAQYCLPLSASATLFLLLDVETDYKEREIICHMETLRKALSVLFFPDG
jgi:hypothetical protein